jgi:hypothetical protein
LVRNIETGMKIYNTQMTQSVEQSFHSEPIKTLRNAAHWNRRPRILLAGDLTASIDIHWLWTAWMASAPVDASNIPATTSPRPLTGTAETDSESLTHRARHWNLVQWCVNPFVGLSYKRQEREKLNTTNVPSNLNMTTWLSTPTSESYNYANSQGFQCSYANQRFMDVIMEIKLIAFLPSIHPSIHPPTYLLTYLPTSIPTYLPSYLSIYLCIYLSIYGSITLLDLGRFFSSLIYTQSAGLLGRGISPLQGCYLHRE